jgi:hypothetical protein
MAPLQATTYSQTGNYGELVAACEKTSDTSWGVFGDVKGVDCRGDTDSDASDESVPCQLTYPSYEENFFLPSDIHSRQVAASGSLHGNTDKDEDRCGHERQSPADIVGQPHGDETAKERSSLNSRDDI